MKFEKNTTYNNTKRIKNMELDLTNNVKDLSLGTTHF